MMIPIWIKRSASKTAEFIKLDISMVKRDINEHKPELKIVRISIYLFLILVFLIMFLTSFLGGGPAFIGCDGKPVYLGCISKSVYAAGEIDVGSPAINRTFTTTINRTYINMNNPANDTGRLVEVEIYVAASLTGLKVGTFFVVSGTTYECRDNADIGSIGTGYHSLEINIEIEAGDFIGFYVSSGTIDRETAAAGYRYVGGEYCDQGDSANFFSTGATTISLGGTGDLPTYSPDCPTGLTGEIIGVAEVGLVWDTAVTSEYYTIRGSFEIIPTDNASEYLVYSGNLTECSVGGLDLNSTVYYFSLWNISSGECSTCLEYIEIGGGDMEIAVVFPINYWIFGAACIFLLAAVFFNKLLLYIALVPLWIGVIATAGNIYIDSAAGIVLLFAIIGMRRAAKKEASGGV